MYTQEKKGQSLCTGQFHWHLGESYIGNSFIRLFDRPKSRSLAGLTEGSWVTEGPHGTLKIYYKTAHTSLHLLRRFACSNFLVRGR